MIGALATFLAFFALAITLLLVRDRASLVLWRLRYPPEKLEAERLAHLQRLSRPDWPYYEKHLGRQPPAELVQWYSEPKRLDQEYRFAEGHVIFCPIDPQSQVEAAWVLPGIVPFADSDGDPIFLKPGASESNGVFIAYHDGGGTEQLAASPSEFLSGLCAR